MRWCSEAWSGCGDALPGHPAASAKSSFRSSSDCLGLSKSWGGGCLWRMAGQGPQEPRVWPAQHCLCAFSPGVLAEDLPLFPSVLSMEAGFSCLSSEEGLWLKQGAPTRAPGAGSRH